jgi:hypothetical protein
MDCGVSAIRLRGSDRVRKDASPLGCKGCDDCRWGSDLNKRRHSCVLWAAGAVCAALAPLPVAAEAEFAAGLSSFGTPGLIEMPGAALPADGNLALGLGLSADRLRATLGFQVAPRLAASVRLDEADGATDQSLSLSYALRAETLRWPAVVIGLTDVVGSDRYRSEFIAATKTVSPTVRVTAGLGWGRLAGTGGFDNPLGLFGAGFEDRAPSSGDAVDLAEAFRGEAALFGGIEWQASDRLRLIAEVSSLDYAGTVEQASPVNLGLSYALTDALTLGAQVLYGAEVGVQLTYAFDPRRPPLGAGVGSAPLPVLPRRSGQGGDLAAGLAAQGLALHALTVSGGVARVEVENRDHAVAARAVGRAARALSRTMPDGVDTFDIVLIEEGIGVSAVRLARADVEALEHDLDGAWISFVRSEIEAAPEALPPVEGAYPRVEYGVGAAVTASIADPDAGLLADVGVDLRGRFTPLPGLVFAGTVRQKLGGTLEQLDVTAGPLPQVRSDLAAYAGADLSVPVLTGSYAFRPAPEVFGRVTAGLFEPMFGGVAGEVLWLPQDSAFALGAEVAYAVQRDPDLVLGFAGYDVVTGHVSGYWDMGGGYHAQLDLGRYLAGDWGGTLTLARDFDNGWRIGAFATLTDAGFDDFGPGEFDRGIMLSIPVGWASGGALRETADLTLRPVLGDGGARLDLDGRLYDVVSPASAGQLASGWAEVWR